MEAGGNYAQKGTFGLLRLLLRFGQFQEVQHLFPDQGASALVAEVHVVFINDHHTHFHPFRPARRADICLHLGLKLAQKQRLGVRFPWVSATDALDLCITWFLPGRFYLSFRGKETSAFPLTWRLGRAHARNGVATCRRPGGEMADAADSKSAGGDTMGVRPSPRAPRKIPKISRFSAI